MSVSFLRTVIVSRGEVWYRSRRGLVRSLIPYTVVADPGSLSEQDGRKGTFLCFGSDIREMVLDDNVCMCWEDRDQIRRPIVRESG